VQDREPHSALGASKPAVSISLGKAEIYAAVRILIVAAWAILPFATVLVAPKDSAHAYFLAAMSCLGVCSFFLYVICFGVTEALLAGLIFITNSAFVDPAYLPRAAFFGGNFFFSDYYIVLACCSIILIGARRKRELLGSYRSNFIGLAVAILLAAFVGMNRGADVHYVLRELHPLIYYPLTIFLTLCALENSGARWRILVVTTGIVIVSCVATFWQLLLSANFQFMTFATPVFGLSQGERLDAQSIRPPSQWLFLAFFLGAVATYPMWKKHRILMAAVLVLDSLCIFLGYSRTILLAVAGGLIFLGFVRKKHFIPFIWGTAKTTVVVALLLVAMRSAVQEIAPGYWEAFEVRIISSFVMDPVDSDRPWVFGSRLYENAMGIEHIREHPFLGLGIGTVYREILPFEYAQTEVSENPDDGRHFMHNTYLYIWMKYGLFGLLAAIWIVWHFLRRTWLLARGRDSEACLSQGILVSFIGLAIANVVAPGFIASPAAPTLVGLMAGFIEIGHSRVGTREGHMIAVKQNASALKSLLSFGGKPTTSGA
jgi:O-Antigen ligase